MAARFDSQSKSGVVDIAGGRSILFGGSDGARTKTDITFSLDPTCPHQLGIILPKLASGTIQMQADKAVIASASMDLELYTRAGDTLEHTEFQFDVVLKTRDEANAAVELELALSNYDRFTFDRIPAFKVASSEIKRGQLWEYTYDRAAYLLDPKSVSPGIGRQAWHQDGYHVRHKSWQNNRKNSTYCHISRPKLIAADGSESWGAINIRGESLIYEFDPLFLATAPLPIRVDPTFGDTTAGTDTVPWSDGRAMVTSFNLTEAATLSKVTVYSGGGTLDNQKGIIYTATSTTTFTARQAFSSSGVINTVSPSWKDLALTGSLSAGNYGVGSVADGGIADEWYKDASGGNDACMANGSLSYASPPASWPGTDVNYSGQLNAYATYSTAGAAPLILSGHPQRNRRHYGRRL